LRLKLDRRRTSPDQQSGQAILIYEILTLNHADNLQLGKTLDQPILRPKT